MRAWLAAAGVLVIAALHVAGTALAQPVEGGVAAQSWYITRSANACVSQTVGCPPQGLPTEVSPYPAGILHVGVTGGQQDAQAYVQLDLPAPPDGAEVTEAVLTLPLWQDPSAGNVTPEAALVACLADEPLEDGVEGGLTEPPNVNCLAEQLPATLSDDGTAFTVDLLPFVERWLAGAPNYGIALLADQRAPGDAWQVSIAGRDAPAETTISAAVSYREPPAPDDEASPAPSRPATMPGVASPPPPPPVAPPPPAATTPRPAPAPAPAALPAEPPLGTVRVPLPSPAPVTGPAAGTSNGAELSAATQAIVPVTIVRHAWYRYPGVVYLPFLLIVMVPLTVRVLTRPIQT